MIFAVTDSVAVALIGGIQVVILATLGLFADRLRRRGQQIQRNTEVIKGEFESNSGGSTKDSMEHMTSMLHAMNRRMRKFENIMLRRMRRVEQHMGLEDDEPHDH